MQFGERSEVLILRSSSLSPLPAKSRGITMLIVADPDAW
jgi:hypothetical protein